MGASASLRKKADDREGRIGIWDGRYGKRRNIGEEWLKWCKKGVYEGSGNI